MNKKEFLKKSDVNILGYEISDTVDNKGNTTVDVLLRIGKTKKEIKKELEALSSEELAKNPKISFSEYEILLTKENLEHLLSEIEAFDKNEPDYIDKNAEV